MAPHPYDDACACDDCAACRATLDQHVDAALDADAAAAEALAEPPCDHLGPSRPRCHICGIRPAIDEAGVRGDAPTLRVCGDLRCRAAVKTALLRDPPKGDAAFETWLSRAEDNVFGRLTRRPS